MERDRFLGVGRDMRISLKLLLEFVIKRKYYSWDVHFNPLLETSSSPARLPQVLNIVMVTYLYSILIELNKSLWTSPAPKTNF